MPLCRVPRPTFARRAVERTRRAPVALVLTLVFALLAAACSTTNRGLTSSAEPGSGSVTTDSTSAPTAEDLTPPPSTRGPDPVDWRPCGDADCADLEAPLDYADPEGSSITIAMSRLPATGPGDQRIGTVFVNFGGPGGEGTETIQSYATFIPRALRERFDIVSWDPRGVEDTAGLGCDGEIGDEPTVLVDPEDGFADEVASDREVWDRVMACVATSPVVDYLSTAYAAADLDWMRQAVGDEQLTYLGFSYGTEIGWVYGTLFPENVRAMVLDGAVPPADGLSEQTFGQLVAIDDAIERWDTGCDQSADCPLRAEGYEQSVLRLMDELEANPIRLDDGSTFGPVDLGNLVVSMTYLDQTDWGPTFVNAVAALDAGDVLPIVDLATTFEGSSEEATFWSVLCADGSGFLRGGDYEALYAEALSLSPIVGQLPGGLFCDDYPGAIIGLPELDTTGTPPLLVIGNTGDNATPYADAVLLDQLLADSVLLTYDGPGHTITFFDACVDEIVVDYFIGIVTPPPGTRCGNPSTSGDGWFVPVDG